MDSAKPALGGEDMLRRNPRPCDNLSILPFGCAV